MPIISSEQRPHLRTYLRQLRESVDFWVERRYRQKVWDAERPGEILSLYQQSEFLEKELAEADPTTSTSIDDQYAPLLKLAVLSARRGLATRLEGQRSFTSHAQVLASLDEHLKPFDEIMAQHWFENSQALRMPKLSDFLALGPALEVLQDQLVISARVYDEKFHILQAPTLLLPDLEYYRQNCDLRDSPLALAYLDIDHFKERLNAPHGETIVDRNVLPRFMACLEAFIYGRGFAYRYGGDEYAMLLPGLDHEEAANALDTLRRRISELRYPGVSETITVSIGLCVLGPQCFLTNAEAEHLAEQAKNHAKKVGRNRISTYKVGRYDPSNLFVCRSEGMGD